MDFDCPMPLNHWFNIWLFSNGHSHVRCPICWQLAHCRSLSIGQSMDLCPISRHRKHLPSWRHCCLSSVDNQPFTQCWLIQSFMDCSVESSFGLPSLCVCQWLPIWLGSVQAPGIIEMSFWIIIREIWLSMVCGIWWSSDIHTCYWSLLFIPLA